MKCVRLSRFVVVAVSVALFAAVARSQDAASVTPVDRQDAGWQQRHEAMNARVKQGNVDLLLIGDSITHGWEGEGKDVWAKFYAKRNAVNLGIGGDRTQHVLWRLDHGNIDGIAPKLAVLMIGTNNVGADSPEQIVAGIKAIVEKLRTKLPQTKVLVLAIFPRGPNNQDGGRQVIAKTNEILSKLADGQNVFYLDIGPKFLAADGTLSKEIMPDLLHLNANSYGTWAEAIEPTVAKLMGEADAQGSVAVTPVDRQDAGWPQRHEAMNARVKQGNVDLLFIGDSITHGWEGNGKDVWNKFYVKRNAVNLGIGGDRTQHVLWRLDHGNIDGIAPKLAVLMIGTNNSGKDSPENIAAGVKAIVEKLRAKLPQTKVLVLAIFPRGPNNQDHKRQANAKANEIISKLADGQNVFYLDIGPKFLAADGTLSTDVMPDLLHLNANSYATWAEAIEPTVKELMGEADAQGSVAVAPVARPDDWWKQRHEAMNARVKQGIVDMIFIGDSITHGWEGAADIWNKFYGKRNAVNLGISGDQTAHVLWRLDHGNIDGIAPKLAVMMIGTNNAGHDPHQAPEEIAKGVKAIVDKLRAKLPQTKVLVLAIFPRGADNNDPIRQITVKANELISKLADGQNVFYLDIGPKFLAADGTLSTDVMPDLLHLNGNSYATWAEAIEPTVKELMGEK